MQDGKSPRKRGSAASAVDSKQPKITAFFLSAQAASDQESGRGRKQSRQNSFRRVVSASANADPPITITLSSDSDTPRTAPAQSKLVQKNKVKKRKKNKRSDEHGSTGSSSSDEHEPQRSAPAPQRRGRRICFRTKSGVAKTEKQTSSEAAVVEILESDSPSVSPEKALAPSSEKPTGSPEDGTTEKTKVRVSLPNHAMKFYSKRNSASGSGRCVHRTQTTTKEKKANSNADSNGKNGASESKHPESCGSETDFSGDENEDEPVNIVKTLQQTVSEVELGRTALPLKSKSNENGFSEADTQVISGATASEEFCVDEDNILSSIDIDEIVKFAAISPSQKSSPPVRVSVDIGLSPAISPSQSRKSPVSASPKPKATYFSPVRYVGKKKEPNKRLFVSPAQVPPPVAANSRLLVFKVPAPAPLETVHSNTSFDVLENFLIILKTVTTDPHSVHLFDEDDMRLAFKFCNLPPPAQNLYIRLFKRSLVWYRQSKIVYKKIALDLEPAFSSLHQSGFFTDIKDAVTSLSLEDLLNLLSKDEVFDLASKMNLKVPNSSKSSSMEALLKMTQTQRTLSKRSSAQVLTDALLQLIGPTFRISEESRDFFTRVFILYSLPQYWDDEANLGANQLLTMLLTKLGNMDYPNYTVAKVTQIYRNRNDLIRFREALTLHSSVQAHIESKEWVEAQNIMEFALGKFKTTILSDISVWKHDSLLKSFLRVYTAGSVLARTVWLGIDAHQKLKQYEKANEVIDFLLSQTETSYLAHYRGRLHERRIINSKHLKETSIELKGHIIKGLSDSFFIGDHMLLELSCRLDKVLQDEKKKKEAKVGKKKRRKGSKSSSDESESEDPFPLTTIDELKKLHPNLRTYTLKQTVPERSVEAEQLHVAGLGERIFGKSTFLGDGASPGGSGISVSSVEHRALEHYRRLGYINGAHGESSIPVALFGLIFWDIIYSDSIPDAFRCPFQALPLDLNFEDFYLQRKILIDDMLHNLRYTWSLSDAFAIIERNWKKNVDKLSIVHWSAVGSVENAKSLVKVIGLKLLADICERFGQNFRHYRSGFPDLMVWDENEIIFVEVKGPGDKLSAKQSIWLDYLISVGAKAEICRVKSVSNKRIRVQANELS